ATREARSPSMKPGPKPRPPHGKQAHNARPVPAAKPALICRTSIAATATTETNDASVNTREATARIASKESSPLLALPNFKIAAVSDNPSNLGGPVPDATPVAPTKPADRSDSSSSCRVLSASYGGTKTLLVRS